VGDDRETQAREQEATHAELPAQGGKKRGRGLAAAAFIVSFLVLLPALAMVIALVAGLFNSGSYVSGEPDRSLQINVETGSLAAHGERLMSEPVISEDEFAIIDGSTATVPITAELLRQFYGYSDESIEAAPYIYHSTTDIAYQHLIYREVAHPVEEEYSGQTVKQPPPVSLILVTPPSDEELRHAKAAGVTLEKEPVALDGFVFIVHRDNPVESLTLEQVRGIYTGAITNWQEVGGSNQKIQAFQREEGSGSQTAMVQMVMQGTPMLPPPMVASIQGMGGLVDEVAAYQNDASSIGYSFEYYVKNLYVNEDIKVLRIEGIEPSSANYLDGSYPLTTAYYAVIRGDEPADSPARRLRDFLLTDTGQRVIEAAGYTRAVA
jgi:phosphate transport system substrate-binding protein